MKPEGSLPCLQEHANCPYLSQMNLVLTLPLYFPEIHFNIILPSSRRSSESSLPFRLSNQNAVRILMFLMRARCPAHLILLYSVVLIVFGEEYTSWGSLCSFLQPPVTSSFLGFVENIKDIKCG
jgi:hypothetical protein